MSGKRRSPPERDPAVNAVPPPPPVPPPPVPPPLPPFEPPPRLGAITRTLFFRCTQVERAPLRRRTHALSTNRRRGGGAARSGPVAWIVNCRDLWPGTRWRLAAPSANRFLPANR